jgi:RNA polymerase sigma-70 factor (ECF subfamily)
MPSDQQLIDAVRAGDESKFSGLLERYQSRLVGLLWHLCGNRELAEDLSQETFLRAYRKLELYSGQAEFYAWLAKIAVNLLASFRRKKSLESTAARQGYEIALELQAARVPPESALETDETVQAVRKAISMLDEERRSVLLLRDFEDLDYESVASILNIPIGTVRSRLHRARLEVKQHLDSIAPHLGSSDH